MLANYKAVSRVIELGDNSISVTGLSLNSFTSLIQKHLDDLEYVFNSIGKLKQTNEVSDMDIEQLIMSIAQELPSLVASVIAIAAGEDNEEARVGVMNITAPKQLEILITIFELTFNEVGGIKKAIEIVTNLMSKMKVKV